MICACLVVVLVMWDKASLGTAMENAFSILMTLESPKTVLPKSLIGIKLLGWIVAFSGWLMIPLLVSAVISHVATETLQERQSRAIKTLRDSRYRAIFREMGRARNLQGVELELFVERMMEVKSSSFKPPSQA